MITKYFSGFGAVIALSYIGMFIYARFTCFNCWGNDLFYAIPFMALVPASLESNIIAKYLVAFGNALLIWLIISGLGIIINFIVSLFKK